jgi:hypothetical protein
MTGGALSGASGHCLADIGQTRYPSPTFTRLPLSGPEPGNTHTE